MIQIYVVPRTQNTWKFEFLLNASERNLTHELKKVAPRAKVLIGDDNEKVRLLLRDHLPASVDEVYECNDGDQALGYSKNISLIGS